MKVVIVGGVAGGASSAARIRRLDEHAQIIMIERSGYVSYANCGLPYYVGGVIKEQEELTLQTPESFWDRFRIDVRVRQEVTAINPAEKTVTVRGLDSGKSYTETYDKLLLAPGAKNYNTRILYCIHHGFANKQFSPLKYSLFYHICYFVQNYINPRLQTKGGRANARPPKYRTF